MVVSAWVCPRCDRSFGRVKQSHLCVPVIPVDVGILIKKSCTFAELRPSRNGYRLSVILGVALTGPRVVRVIGMSGHRVASFIELRSLHDVDDEVFGWLAESYTESPE